MSDAINGVPGGKVKRYEVYGPDWDSEENPFGFWVMYSDYAVLEAECERLRAGKQLLIGDLERRNATVEGLRAENALLRAASTAKQGEAVEVVGYRFFHVDHGYIFRRTHIYEGNPSLEAHSLMTVAQHNRILADMRQQLAEWDAEIERLRMQLVACGVVALANTPKSASEARQMHQDYMSASCSDVANAVDREMTLRQQCDKLAELLDQTITEVGKTITPELRECIDAALAASTGQEVEKDE